MVLANKVGKHPMYMDFIDVNLTIDCFPLPNIDQLVDTATRFE